MITDPVWPRKIQYLCDLLDQARTGLQRLADKSPNEISSNDLWAIRSPLEEASQVIYQTAHRIQREKDEEDDLG